MHFLRRWIFHEVKTVKGVLERGLLLHTSLLFKETLLTKHSNCSYIHCKRWENIDEYQDVHIYYYIFIIFFFVLGNYITHLFDCICTYFHVGCHFARLSFSCYKKNKTTSTRITTKTKKRTCYYQKFSIVDNLYYRTQVQHITK